MISGRKLVVLVRQAPLMLQLLLPVLLLGALYSVCLLAAISGSRLCALSRWISGFFTRSRRLAIKEAGLSSVGKTKPVTHGTLRSSGHEDLVCTSPRRGFVYNSSWADLHPTCGSGGALDESQPLALPPSCMRATVATSRSEGCTAV